MVKCPLLGAWWSAAEVGAGGGDVRVGHGDRGGGPEDWARGDGGGVECGEAEWAGGGGWGGSWSGAVSGGCGGRQPRWVRAAVMSAEGTVAVVRGRRIGRAVTVVASTAVTTSSPVVVAMMPLVSMVAGLNTWSCSGVSGVSHQMRTRAPSEWVRSRVPSGLAV